MRSTHARIAQLVEARCSDRRCYAFESRSGYAAAIAGRPVETESGRVPVTSPRVGRSTTWWRSSAGQSAGPSSRKSRVRLPSSPPWRVRRRHGKRVANRSRREPSQVRLLHPPPCRRGPSGKGASTITRRQLVQLQPTVPIGPGTDPTRKSLHRLGIPEKPPGRDLEGVRGAVEGSSIMPP